MGHLRIQEQAQQECWLWRNGVWRTVLDSSGLGWNLIAEFFEHGYENLDFITTGKFKLSDDKDSPQFTHRQAQVEFCAVRNWVYSTVIYYIYIYIYVCVCVCVCVYVCTRGFSWNPKCEKLECDRPQHDCPAVCVIAQQYSSVTFVSKRFHSGDGNFFAPLKNYNVSFFYTF